MSFSQLEQNIKKKIAVEENIIRGASALKKKTSNVMVIQKCNTNIREARQNLEYLEDSLKKLRLKTAQQSQGENGSEDNVRCNSKEYGFLSTKSPNEHIFSRLDLVKYDCPSLAQRIQYMLQQLEFKLQVEKQYQEANTKLTKLYQIDGDQRSSSVAEGGAMESKYRIQMLNKALKKYQAINVDFDQFKHQPNDIMDNQQPKFRRKQLTGVLTIGITAARDVDHIQSPMFARKPESYVTIKIDDTIKARTKPSRNDRWSEDFQIPVEKGNEIEITVYDKVNDSLIPVAIMWLLLSDIAEEIRKKKAGQTNEQQGWVNASNINGGSSLASEEGSTLTSTYSNSAIQSTSAKNVQGENTSTSQISTNSWFVLEPSGQILLTLGFHKSSQIERKQLMGGLHRHGAIINRKEEIFEQHGHHFVQKSFYNIMCCAYCGDFLRYTGFQCQDCKFLCHKKCYTNVVTKCIAKTSTDTDPDEAKLNHRIPHRFLPTSNRGTKWCCHCGYILPWGRHKVRKCSECGIMCHAQCAHLVPDFCGMSMEMANKILKTIQDTKRNQEKKKRTVPSAQLGSSIGTANGSDLSPSKLAERANAPLPPQPRKHDKTPSPQKVGRDSPTKQHDPIIDKRIPLQTHGREKLNKFIDENEAYLNFTEGAQQTAEFSSPEKTLDPTSNRRSLGLTDLSIEHSQTWESKDDLMRDELELWKAQREEMELEIKQDSGEIQEDLEVDHIDLETKQKLDWENKNDFREADLTIDSTHTNPFRDMNSETFQIEQDHASKEVLQETVSLAPTSTHASRTTDQQSPQKSQTSTSAKHKKRAAKRRKVSLDNFVLLKVLGKGNFGKVILSKSKNTDRLCAIKVLKKDNIIQNHDIESARAEKKVFLLATKTKHPFLTNLYCSFQTENRIYFAMEFIGGGDLMWHVQNQRLSVRRAKFYAAEVLLALKYFHDNGVIYRDLKLENILLTPEGHIKIADYGLCKDEMWYGNRTSTFCGTPEFMAPEILKEQEYTKAVDWWAFGVLLYQMLLCQSPFSGDDEDEVFNAILTDEPLYPIDMAGEIVQIFQGLLTKDPEKRLGAGRRDADEVMEEPFFRNINFDDILNLRVKPPYIPEIKSPEDTSYFEQEFTSAPPTLTPLPSVLTTSQQEEFRGFSFMPDDLDL
ncbi:Pkc1p [Saccharomyces cerevisiae YJM1304]|nr:Pkc1p [Saccharomyces cerevisiae YJM1304]